MKILYTFLFLCLFAFTSCEEEQINQSCVVGNPTQNLPWLKAKVDELKTSEYCQFVQTGTLQGRSVFVIGNCDPAIDAIHPVYDCEGNLLCFGGDETCPNFYNEVEELKVIWTNGK